MGTDKKTINKKQWYELEHAAEVCGVEEWEILKAIQKTLKTNVRAIIYAYFKDREQGNGGHNG